MLIVCASRLISSKCSGSCSSRSSTLTATISSVVLHLDFHTCVGRETRDRGQCPHPARLRVVDASRETIDEARAVDGSLTVALTPCPISSNSSYADASVGYCGVAECASLAESLASPGMTRDEASRRARGWIRWIRSRAADFDLARAPRRRLGRRPRSSDGDARANARAPFGVRRTRRPTPGRLGDSTSVVGLR